MVKKTDKLAEALVSLDTENEPGNRVSVTFDKLQVVDTGIEDKYACCYIHTVMSLIFEGKLIYKTDICFFKQIEDGAFVLRVDCSDNKTIGELTIHAASHFFIDHYEEMEKQFVSHLRNMKINFAIVRSPYRLGLDYDKIEFPIGGIMDIFTRLRDEFNRQNPKKSFSVR